MNKKLSVPGILFAATLLLANLSNLIAQAPPSGADRDNAQAMLSTIKSDLEKYYYDPNYHGMNVDERFKTAEEKLKQATTLAQLLGVIGQVLLDLDDSHTFFVPPSRTFKTDYGWQMTAVGDRVLVSAVKPKSDAEAKGLKPGDEVLSIDGMKTTRENLWKIRYLFYQIRPRPGMRLSIVKPTGEALQLDVAAKVETGKKVIDLTAKGQGYDTGDLIRESENDERLNRQRYIEIGDTFIWKMPSFSLDEQQTRDMVGKAKKSKNLVLDLRGNGGGYEDMLLALIGSVSANEIKVGEIKRRKEAKVLLAKSRGKEAFTGKIVVLIDSESGSAAELFARVMQLEKRGIVIGDRSAGAVMRSRQYGHEVGIGTVIPYAVSVTDADIIMTDGKSLERVGVTPDEVKLISPADMAAKRDTVLAYALSLAGVDITPEKAHELFPLEWAK